MDKLSNVLLFPSRSSARLLPQHAPIAPDRPSRSESYRPLQAAHFPAYHAIRFSQEQTLPITLGKDLVEALEQRLTRADKDFQEQREHNTPAPASVYHNLIEEAALKTSWDKLNALEMYIRQSGEKNMDIPFVRRRLAINDYPILVIDTETSDLYVGPKGQDSLRLEDRTRHDEKHVRIIQLAGTSFQMGQKTDYKNQKSFLFNPGILNGMPIKIHPKAERKHGISDALVADKPTIESRLIDIRTGEDPFLAERGLVAAYNAEYDIPLLNASIARVDDSELRGKLRKFDLALIIDPMILLQRLHPFLAMRRRLENHSAILMGKRLEGAHNAQADVHGTIDILKYVFKYLQKHTIPIEWAAYADADLRTQLGKGVWDKLESKEKMSMIIEYVRKPQNRTFLERQKVQPVSLRYIDVLRLQHGGLVKYDQAEIDQFAGKARKVPIIDYFPKLDLPINDDGYDDTRLWNGTDTMDVDIVREVRKERQQEAHTYVDETFRNDFPKDAIKDVAQSITQLNTQGRYNPDEVQKRIVKALAKELVPKILSKSLPNSTDDETFKKQTTELQNTLKQFMAEYVKKRLPKEAVISEALQGQIDGLVNATMDHLDALKEKFGLMDFYHEIAEPEASWLIDPAVIKSTLAAQRLDAKIADKYKNAPPPVLKEVFGENWRIFIHPKLKDEATKVNLAIDFLFLIKRHNGPVDQYAKDIIDWFNRSLSGRKKERPEPLPAYLKNWIQRYAPAGTTSG